MTAMTRDPMTVLPLLCVVGMPGRGRTALVRALHDQPGDALAGRMASAKSQLQTTSRRWLVVDAAGEGELLRELVRGGVESPTALVVVDVLDPCAAWVASTLAALKLLGLRDAVVAVNRLDTAKWREDDYTAASRALVAALAPLALRACAIVPVCATTGANVRARADATWWTGPTLVDALDTLPAFVPRAGGPLRFPVEDVLASGERRIAVGRVASGTIAAGQEVLILPGNRSTQVETFAGSEAARASATIGEQASVALAAGVPVERGDLLCSPEAPPKLTAVFDAEVRWLGPGDLANGSPLVVQAGARDVRAHVLSIHHALDASGAHRPAAALREGDIARITVRCETAIAVDDAKTLPATGRFLLADADEIVGVGVIDASGYPDQRRTRPASGAVVPVRHQISAGERGARAGHHGAVVWLTGLSGAGKSTLAIALERRLFDLGWQVYTLDGDNVRTGLNADLGFKPEDRQENLRRVGEVAALFADAGIVCVTAFISPYRDERARARTAAGARPFVEVWVRSPLEECERRDPKGLYRKARAGALKDFTGIDSPYEPPDSADLVIDTEHLDIEASTRMLVDFVVARCKA